MDGLVTELGADELDFLLLAAALESYDDAADEIGGGLIFDGTLLANFKGGDSFFAFSL